MSFLIWIDNPKQVYTGGETLKGAVVLKCLQDQAVGRVQISFYGRAKTKIHRNNGQTRITYRGRGMFFNFEKLLYAGHYTMRGPETYEWPFEFVFPERTLACPQEKPWERKAPFVDVPNHPLPPTFSCTHHGFTANFESFVEYRLEAKLTRPPESYIIHSFGLESGLSLTYSPPRSVESPNPELLRTMRICTAQSLLLLPENEGRSLTFKEKTKSLFNSSQLPSSIFRLTVEQPSQICTGGRCPFFIGIEHLLEKSTAPAIPVVKLRKFTLTARAITSVRAQGHLFGSPTDTSEDKIYLDTRSNLNIPVTERMDLSKIFSTRFNSNALPPTFTTYNIARTYSLDFKIVVQCADKDFDLECGGLPLRVLPAIYHPPNDNTGRSQDLSEQSGGVPQMTEPHLGGPADEPLPRYEPPAYSVDGGPTGANGTAPAIDFGDVKRSHHLKNGDMQI